MHIYFEGIEYCANATENFVSMLFQLPILKVLGIVQRHRKRSYFNVII